MVDSQEVLTSFCLDNVNFTIISAQVSQDEAIEGCDELGFTLGPVRGQIEFGAVRGALLQQDFVNENFYFGLEVPQDVRPLRQNGNPDPTDTTAFRFLDPLDEEGLDIYHVPRGNFPWANEGDVLEPKDATEHCAILDFSSNLNRRAKLDDSNCNNADGFICRGPCFVPSTAENTIEEIASTNIPILTLFLLVVSFFFQAFLLRFLNKDLADLGSSNIE